MDCLEGMKQIPDNTIDLVITSPPYDNLRTYDIDLDWGEHIWKPVIQELFRIVKEGGVVVWVVGDATINGSETGTSFRQALYFKEVGFNIHDTMIWEKPTFTATGTLQIRYADVFDYMFIFSKGKPKTFNPIKDRTTKGIRKKNGTVRQPDGTTKKQTSIGKSYDNKFAQRFNIWKINGVMNNKKRFHPAQFPEELVHDQIISWSNEQDTILDPFMGSGTTAVVCKKKNRNYIGFDLSDEYVRVSNERLYNVPLRLDEFQT